MCPSYLKHPNSFCMIPHLSITPLMVSFRDHPLAPHVEHLYFSLLLSYYRPRIISIQHWRDCNSPKHLIVDANSWIMLLYRTSTTLLIFYPSLKLSYFHFHFLQDLFCVLTLRTIISYLLPPFNSLLYLTRLLLSCKLKPFRSPPRILPKSWNP